MAEAGIDTWRLVRYLDDDRDLARALALCRVPVSRGLVAPERLAGHVVGVSPAHRLLFAEGHPAVEGLAAPGHLGRAEARVLDALADYGLPAGRDGGVGRLDQTVTLRWPDRRQGVTFLAGLAAVDVPRVKPAVYGRPVETVYFLGERSGRVLARVYDAGLRHGTADTGTLIRLENQSRFGKQARMTVREIMEGGHVSTKFESRFAPVADSTDGVTAATLPVLAERLGELSRSGAITTRQAEILGGYLLLQGIGGPRYSAETRRRRRRALRRHGLVLADALAEPVEVDLGEALDAALAAWSRDGQAA